MRGLPLPQEHQIPEKSFIEKLDLATSLLKATEAMVLVFLDLDALPAVKAVEVKKVEAAIAAAEAVAKGKPNDLTNAPLLSAIDHCRLELDKWRHNLVVLHGDDPDVRAVLESSGKTMN